MININYHTKKHTDSFAVSKLQNLKCCLIVVKVRGIHSPFKLCLWFPLNKERERGRKREGERERDGERERESMKCKLKNQFWHKSRIIFASSREKKQTNRMMKKNSVLKTKKTGRSISEGSHGGRDSKCKNRYNKKLSSCFKRG